MSQLSRTSCTGIQLYKPQCKLIITSPEELSELCSSFGRFQELKELTIKNFALTKLPYSFEKLTSLEKLTLGYLTEVNELCSLFDRLQTLKELTIERCTWTTLPDTFGKLSSLEKLTLGYLTGVNELCSSFEGLEALKHLTIERCTWTTLPDIFGKLASLENLRFVDLFGLNEISSSFGRLQALKQLTIDGCALTKLPDSFDKLSNLKNLDLVGFPELKELCLSFGELRSLRQLRISGCALTELPQSFGKLPGLETLSLHYLKELNELPFSFGELKTLRELTIDCCAVTKLPDTFGKLASLGKLCLNRLERLNELCSTFGDLRALKILSIEGCPLTSLPDGFGKLTSLQTLTMRYLTGLTELCSSFGELPALKELTIKACVLKELPESFGKLTSLRSLDLSNNDLQEYPASLLRLENLEVLNLSNENMMFDFVKKNHIGKLPLQLAFTNLRFLELRGNPITEPRKEIWQQGVDAIRSFMRALLPGGMHLRADTVNMLGDTGAGKTSLAQSLIAQAPFPTLQADHTRVMQQLRMRVDNVSGSVIINDFGGHEVYHSVMPIFLPTSGIFMLVFNLTRSFEERKESIKRWLLTAIAKCEEIRIVIVGTHADMLKESSERSQLGEHTRNWSTEILATAFDELSSHKSKIECLPDDSILKQTKLPKLNLLLSRVQSALDTVRFTMLSCFVRDENLFILRDLVVGKLQQPQQFPIRWCSVINEILKTNPSGFYIEMSDVKKIAHAHFTCEDDDDNALTTILRFLSKTALIIWVDDHPQLKHLIFHIPQKIVDACKKILHHDSKIVCDENECKEYEKGIVRESLLRELWKRAVNLDRSQAQLPVSALTFERTVDFLERFNLISQVATNSTERKYVIPCKLPADEPPEMEKFMKAAEKCQNRIAVRLSFLGSVVPLSFFETSLTAMLTAAGKLSNSLFYPWKNGVIVFFNGLQFIAKLSDGSILLKAFCMEPVTKLWTVLGPMLHCLTEQAITWHGALPKCLVQCPHCIGLCQPEHQQSEVGEIETDLQQLAGHQGQYDTVKPTCPKCHECIDRRLCFPPVSHGRANVSGTTLQTVWRSLPSREKDYMPKEKSFRELFIENSNILIQHLTHEEVKEAARELFSMNMMIAADLERVLLGGKTPTDAAWTLVDLIIKKDDKKVYDAFLEILETKLHRAELVKTLTTVTS